MRDFVIDKVKNIKPSGIRRFFDLVAGSQDKIISLGVGDPDFTTPWEIRNEGAASVMRGRTHYSSNIGLPDLRNALSEYLDTRFSVRYAPEEIMLTIGASEAIDATLRAVVDVGDEVLIPDPSYVSYAPCVELCGGVPVSVPCFAENGFKLTPEMLEKCVTPRTKALIFPYPNNPTGGIMEREYLEALVPAILKHDILVISDEIYAELTYGQRHASIAAFPEMRNNVVLINGFSKSFAMTGWRIGFLCAEPNLFKNILKIHQYTTICAPIMSQYAALKVVRDGLKNNFVSIADMRDEYDKRRRFLYRSFNAMGLKCFEPKGAFYVLPSVAETGMTGEEFAEKLLREEKVAVVPGSAFGESGKYFVRCSYATSMKDLKEAVGRIRAFVARLK